MLAAAVPSQRLHIYYIDKNQMSLTYNNLSYLTNLTNLTDLTDIANITNLSNLTILSKLANVIDQNN